MVEVTVDQCLADVRCCLAIVGRQARRWIRLAHCNAGQISYATGHQWYAEFLSLQGRFNEALAESDRARLLDPLSLIIAADHAAILYYSRQYDRSIEEFLAVMQMDEAFPRGRAIISPYVEEKRFEEALGLLQKWHSGAIDASWVQSEEAFVYARAGREGEAWRALRQYQKSIPGGWYAFTSGQGNQQWREPTSEILSIYIDLGRKEEAMTLLEKSYAVRSNAIVYIKVDPNLDRLRADPRFQRLLKRVGFTD